MKSEKISFCLENKNIENYIFLTFDIDWCSDEVLEYTLDLLEKFSLKTTFFVTHKTKLLENMKKNENIELGIHPNFNFLLNGDFRYGKSIGEIVNYYKNIVPKAISVRSHSVTQNSQILSCFEKNGLLIDSNIFIPYESKIVLKSFKCGNILRVPYFCTDDIRIIRKWDYNVNDFINSKGLKVFDFHPIHIFLNTENLERYNKARPYLQDYKKLKEFVNNKTYGTRDFLIDLITKDRVVNQ